VFLRRGLAEPVNLDAAVPHDHKEKLFLLDEVEDLADYHQKKRTKEYQNVCRRYAGDVDADDPVIVKGTVSLVFWLVGWTQSASLMHSRTGKGKSKVSSSQAVPARAPGVSRWLPRPAENCLCCLIPPLSSQFTCCVR
jgi:hypothetical protein